MHRPRTAEAMTLTNNLAHEWGTVQATSNLESRARRVRRDIVLLKDALKQYQLEQRKLIVLLHEDYGWTDAALASYFRLGGKGSRQNSYEIRKRMECLDGK